MKTKVTIEVGLEQFQTYELIEELYERIYDSLHDEEERFDPLLNNMDDNLKEIITEAMRPVYTKIYEDRRANKIVGDMNCP